MKRFIGLLMVASALGACSGNKSKAGETQPATANLPVKATMGEGFSLTAASDFLVDIEGCVTTHTAQLTQADSSAVLIPGDHNCVAKLKSFSVSGVSYTPSSSSPDFSLAQQLIYEGTDGSHLMVTVSKQLPSTLSLPAGEDCLEVEFRYNGITKGVSKDIIEGRPILRVV